MPHEFYESWYAKHLRALHEEPLCCTGTESPMIVRFTWLPSFHHPVVIRVEQIRGKWNLQTKVGSGAGGYDPGYLIVNDPLTLEDDDAAKVLAYFDDASTFWGLPSRLDDPEIVVTDGAVWIVEARHGARYVVTTTDTLQEPVRGIGLLLMSLSKRDFGEVY